MYAIVEVNGKQYKAVKGEVLEVDRIEAETGSSMTFDTVVMVSDAAKVQVGTPYVKGAKVAATVEDTFKDKKITIFKYKRRKNYSRKQGHRQQLTRLRVTEVSA
ncbi:MAG: 50S ribosomal protein L21 [Spirochaetaceae bacterium]|nr:MAG: 50S ribosomal protein L21 [Spirochaetaceae bacterium]